jgi:hypothetical protein
MSDKSAFDLLQEIFKPIRLWKYNPMVFGPIARAMVKGDIEKVKSCKIMHICADDMGYEYAERKIIKRLTNSKFICKKIETLSVGYYVISVEYNGVITRSEVDDPIFPIIYITNGLDGGLLDIDNIYVQVIDVNSLTKKFLIARLPDYPLSNFQKNIAIATRRIRQIDMIQFMSAVSEGIRFYGSEHVRDAWFSYDQLSIAWSKIAKSRIPYEIIEKIMSSTGIHITKIPMELNYIFVGKIAIRRLGA